jgi:hypothetical protein
LKILFTGRGTSGSWQIRGVQLGAALGADVQPMVSKTSADVVVAVKRIPDPLLAAIRGSYVVWDVVDAWPQPRGNDWSADACKAWLDSEFARINPNAIIAATNKMAEDCARFGVPVLWLPHHHRPGIEANPIREKIQMIGYEGAPSYIIPWLPAIESACIKIGAAFLMNPLKLADVDIVLALRGSTGYAPRNWKSGVKLANAHGSGTPWIGCRETGYIETSTGGEKWADTEHELVRAIEDLQDVDTRRNISAALRVGGFSVNDAAEKLRGFLNGL